MARTINETAEVKKVESVNFVSRRVKKADIFPSGTQIIIKAVTELSDGGDPEITKEKSNILVIADSGSDPVVEEPSVQDVLDAIEAFEGSAPVLSELSLSDFIHSVIHERL